MCITQKTINKIAKKIFAFILNFFSNFSSPLNTMPNSLIVWQLSFYKKLYITFIEKRWSNDTFQRKRVPNRRANPELD